MALALEEARKGIGKTAPNPPVGAVIVKHGKLLGKGWHRAAGKLHAEREAILNVENSLGSSALLGATMYVTLEPCSTIGRTPPCTDAIISSGIRRVVYATRDRNPAHSGNANYILAKKNIEVVSGVAEQAAEKLLRPFFKVQQSGIPWLIWKVGMSLDGKTTRPASEGQWITNEESRSDVQILRSQVEAIITSGQTVRRDMPALTIRVPELCEGREQPWRVIFSNKPETIPSDAPLLCDEFKHRTIIRNGSNIITSLQELASQQGVTSALVETGGNFSALLFELDVIDEIVVYVAPLLCGGPDMAIAGSPLLHSLKLKETEFNNFGDNIRIRGVIDRTRGESV